MSDTRLSSSLRSVRQGLDPDSRRAALVERMRYRPWAPTVCERCDPAKLPRGLQPHHVLVDVEPFYGGLRPSFTARSVPCPSCAGTGSPLQARLTLAAYCGDEPCMLVLGGAYSPEWQASVNELRLDVWARGLSRWSDLHESAPGWVLVRAAVAAARVTLPHVAGLSWPDAREQAANRGVAAAEAWLACPCDRHAGACWRVITSGSPEPESGEAWWRAPAAMVPWDNDAPRSAAYLAAAATSGAEAAARLAGEQPVRSAISSSLRSWALGEDGGQSS